jgi:hypothetical protein
MVPDPKTTKKAQKLFESGSIKKLDSDTFEVKSLTNSETSYNVVKKKCNCKGFKYFYVNHKGLDPTCSHLEAVKLFNDSQGIQ